MIDLAQLADDRLAIVGTTGSGKTYAAKGMVERLVASGARVCIVDPLSVWWGLRAGADGDAAGGLPVVILGGAHADVPIGEHDGGRLGAMLASAPAQCVIDIADLGSAAAQRRFMRAFLTALYDANREPLHLVLDEADLWAPQRPGPEHAVLQGKVSEIVRRGRVRGFTPWLITQRPAVLDKDVLSQAEALIAMKLTSSQDRAAIGGWIEGQADKARQKDLLAALPRLERGHGWVWAPGRGILKQVAFPPIATFDSSRTPERGEALAPVGALAFVDAEAFRALMGPGGATTEPVAAASKADLEAAYQRGREVGFEEGFSAGRAAWVKSVRDQFERAAEAFAVAMAKVKEGLEARATPAAERVQPSAPTALAQATRRLPRPPAKLDQTKHTAPEGELPAPTQRILSVLAAHAPLRLTEAQWAVNAVMTRRGGAWQSHRRALSVGGFVEQVGGRWGTTPKGLSLLGLADASPEGPDQVLAWWKAALGATPGRMLDALAAHPEGLTREQLAALVNMTATGGSFLSAVRTLTQHEVVVSGRGMRLFLAEGLRAERSR